MRVNSLCLETAVFFHTGCTELCLMLAVRNKSRYAFLLCQLIIWMLCEGCGSAWVGSSSSHMDSAGTFAFCLPFLVLYHFLRTVNSSMLRCVKEK